MKYSILSICCFVWVLNLSAQSNLSFKQVLNEPVVITEVDSGHYFIDFGKAYFGTVTLKSKSPISDSLIVRLGERNRGFDSIDRQPGGTVRYQQVVLDNLLIGEETTVELVPDKRNTKPMAIALPDSFGVIIPFRYCEIENLTVPISDLEIHQKGYHYTFNDEASYFHSSDSIIDAIYDLCKHTIKATTFAGYYVDGDRERIPYEADAFINQLSHYAVDSVYSIARRTNAYFIDHCTWPTEWILHTPLVFYYDYLYTNDLSSVEKHYESLKLKTLIALEVEDGFISSKSENLTKDYMKALDFSNFRNGIRDIVDWPKGERDNYEFKDINTVVNAFYYESLRVMAILAKDLGRNSDAKTFKDKSERVKKSIQELLIDPHTGLFVDGVGSNHSSLHGNMFPLAFGLVPEQNLSQIIAFIKSKGMVCSVYGAQYLLEGLCNSGQAEYALELIADTTGLRNWNNMIKVGSTMTLEAWDAKYKDNLDWNHAWGTAPLNILARCIWGITPGTSGFELINIKPQLCSLDHTSIKVPTINGCVEAKYIKEDDVQTYNIHIPHNTIAHFYVESDSATVYLNDKKIKLRKPYIILKDQVNTLKLTY